MPQASHQRRLFCEISRCSLHSDAAPEDADAACSHIGVSDSLSGGSDCDSQRQRDQNILPVFHFDDFVIVCVKQLDRFEVTFRIFVTVAKVNG